MITNSHIGGIATTTAFEAFSSCCEQIRTSFVPLEFSCPRGQKGSFVSEFDTREIGPLQFTSATVSSSFPFVGQRRRESITHEAQDRFMLVLPRSGRVRHTQFGRSDVTAPGKMILIDGRAPYQNLPEMSTSSLHISLPGAPLRTAVGVPEDYCAIAIDMEHGFNAAFCDFLFSIWREADRLDEPQKNLLSKECLEMLSASLQTLGGLARPVRPAHCDNQHFEKALRFIETNLGDPTLGPKQVARALRLSDSRLHAIARSKGTSIGQTILEMRLEHCRKALADPRCALRGITEIAFDWGFSNGAHFSHTFKAKFGLSPREFRKLSATHS